MAWDRFGRELNYLRISLTDHCNLRCLYCMPENVQFRPSAEMIQDEELMQFVQLFSSLGFSKFRLTGGEPTIRPGIVEIVREIVRTPGVKTVTMTTNGVLFSDLAQSLVSAGLKRVNFSLDTLDMERYRQLTRRDALENVLEGIRAAEQAGLLPIKINVVVVGGFNENDIIELASLTLIHPWQVRFIEMMPFGKTQNFQISKLVTSMEIMSALEANLGKLEVLNEGRLDGEARVYHIPGSKGEIGFISSITHPFCASCNRIRLTADGKMRLCLLREDEVDLLTPLREGVGREALRQLIVEGIWDKPWGNLLAERVVPVGRVMSEIGG